MSVENNNYILDTLIENFNDTGWPVDVNKEKLLNRSTVHAKSSEPNIKVVKIERHRAILGDQYSKGLSMNAYQTYWMSYSVNELTHEVIDLGEQAGPCSIDIEGLVEKHLDNESFSLNIEPIDDGLYLIEEHVYNLKREITSVEEICDCIFEIMPGFVDYFRMLIDLQDSIDQIEKDKFISGYQLELRKQLIEKANRLWEERA